MNLHNIGIKLEDLMRTTVILLSLVILSTALANNECDSYLNPEHQNHFLHSKLFKIDIDEVPLDTIFFEGYNKPLVFKNPFIWLIKDRLNNTVGAFVGTAHKYVSVDMMPDAFFDIMSRASLVMTEHSSQLNGDLNTKLMRPSSNHDSVFNQISATESYKINTDFINFNRIKREVSRRLKSHVFFAKQEINTLHFSIYGFLTRLSEVAEIASSELRTQPIQFDDKIGQLARHHGASWQFLEEGPFFLNQIANGYTLKQLKSQISNNTNLFVEEYLKHRKFLIAYQEGNLPAFDDYVSSFTSYERKQILTLRNQTWIPRILTHLNSQSFTVIAAGVLHFAGEDNLIQLLEAEGYTIERIQIE